MADNPSDAQPPQIPASQPTQMPSHQPSPKNKSSNRTSSNRILLWGAAAVGALAALGIGAYFLSSYWSNDTDPEKSGDAQQISEFVADEDKIVGADESAIGTDESAKIAQQQDKDAEKYTFSNYSIDDKIELSLKTSLEGKRSILSDAVNDSDIINVFLQLTNAETYEGQTLRVRYWMLSRDNYVFATQGFNEELRGKLISLGERSDLKVSKGSAHLEGIFEYDPLLEESYKERSPAINPFADDIAKKLESDRFAFLVQVGDQRGQLIAARWWGLKGSRKTPLTMQFTTPEAAAETAGETQPASGRKKIFVYEQRLGTVYDRQALASCDYYQPHLYDAKNCTEKCVNKDDIVITPLASDAYLKRLKNRASRSTCRVTPMLSAFYMSTIDRILSNPERDAKLIAEMVKSEGWRGIVIDFESTRADTNDAQRLVEFMRFLREQLPNGQYVVSIATSPRFRGSVEEGFTHHGFYDLAGLGNHVDYIQLMGYDFHDKQHGASAILPSDRINPIVEYTKSKIGTEKIVFLMPFYGFVWDASTRQGISSISPRANSRYLENATSHDYVDGELMIVTPNRLVTTQDEKVMKLRHDALDALGIINAGYWRWSHGTTEMHDEVRAWKSR